jgi:uncharacterized protein YuzE
MQEAKLFEQAAKRAALPEKFISLSYRKETDLLAIRFSDRKRAYSKGDMREGIIYDYDSKDNLVGVEILDFGGISIAEDDNELLEQITLVEEITKTERAARRKNRKRKIVRHCCKVCGQPKNYICLKHNDQIKPTIHKLIPKKLRYYSKKLYFNVARKLGFVG